MVSSSTTVKVDWTYATTLVGRICLSAIFLISGVGKLIAPAATNRGDRIGRSAKNVAIAGGLLHVIVLGNDTGR